VEDRVKQALGVSRYRVILASIALIALMSPSVRHPMRAAPPARDDSANRMDDKLRDALFRIEGP